MLGTQRKNLACRRGRHAFTLVEAVVVICVLALLASGSLMMLSGPLRKASRQGTVVQLIDVHHWARRHSARQPATMVLDLSGQRVAVISEDVRAPAGASVEFGEHTQLKKVILDGAVLESGKVKVTYVGGGSPTYAMLLTGSTRAGKWILVCGPTGQTKVYSGDESIEGPLVDWLAQWANAY